MDNIDLQILKILQEDCSQPVAEIAKKVGLSASPCWKRINRLQKEGIIRFCIIKQIPSNFIKKSSNVFIEIHFVSKKQKPNYCK